MIELYKDKLKENIHKLIDSESVEDNSEKGKILSSNISSTINISYLLFSLIQLYLQFLYHC